MSIASKTAKNTADTPETRLQKIARWASYALAAVLVLMPFHAFLTVALADNVGQYDALRLWKEAALLLLVVPATVVICKRPALWRELRGGWLFWCIMAYVVMHIGLGLVAFFKGQVNEYALVYAWVINLRLVVIFMVGLALASISPWLRQHWRHIILWPAGIVVAFGLLQFTVLPADFLQRFGYGTDTITAYTTVDQKQDYVRVQSTLRGPNPLGAYLVLVIAAAVALLMKGRHVVKSTNRQVIGVSLLSASLIVLMATYSRSAYIGAAVAVLVAVALVLRDRRARRWLVAGLVASVLIVAGLTLSLRQNDRFENIFFHTNEHSQSVSSSNESRWASMERGFMQVVREPFGRGPGTAGPASEHNVRPGRIAENYYIQIAQEIGWLGLALFVTILVLIAQRLWQRRDEVLARVLLATLAGLSVVNLMQHTWADDTIGLVWWGLAGIAYATTVPSISSSKKSPGILNTSNQKHDKAKTKPQAKQKEASKAAPQA